MSLLVKIDRFLRHTQMPPTRFGRLVVNDPRLVGDLKNGRLPGPTIVARVDAFVATYHDENGLRDEVGV
ncbi:MAG: hypothetical protein K2P68_09505 [Sphingomonas sp.]|nr:hypothetical protein [Sphingomonas sp.]